MRVITLMLFLSTFLLPLDARALLDPNAAVPISNLEALLDRAISDNLIAGGVVVVGNSDGILATSARGKVSSLPDAPAITDRTVFDVASLTKVVATTPAVIKLLDEGRVNLTDPLSNWFPEFAGTGHGELTVLHLMTHTSGLSDVAVSSNHPIESVVRKAAAQLRRSGPGTSFKYADINFILLGELVHRVSGAALDEFCREQIYDPLGTRETLFLPSSDLVSEVAPTSGTRGGLVQDMNARRLGGVAGHAGLFSSAYDLSRFARLILGRGVLDGARILSEQAITQMTTPYLCSNGKVLRGLGWDIESPYSAPKGQFFTEHSFGHTGYSGSSIWIDPQLDLFVVMLTRRADYKNVSNFNQLRRDVSTVAAAGFNAVAGADFEFKPVPVKVAKRIKPRAHMVAKGSARKAKGSYQVARKARSDKNAATCSTGTDRKLAKVRAGVRKGKAAKIAKGAKVRNVAKSEARKSKAPSRKRRTLPRS